jgi:hypothetical protein
MAETRGPGWKIAVFSADSESVMPGKQDLKTLPSTTRIRIHAINSGERNTAFLTVRAQDYRPVSVEMLGVAIAQF